MSTPYSNIYTRAINLLEDPRVTSAFESNPIDFFQIMYGYLDNAIPLFITPQAMQSKLSDRTEPTGQIELFNGDGINDTFVLSTTPSIGAVFSFLADGSLVNGTYNSIGNEVVLDSIPSFGIDNVSIEWYDEGQFNQTLISRQELILALLLVQCWTEKEKNFLLDVRRLLSDTDFRLISEANSTNSKLNWFINAREHAETEMKKYSWDVYQENLKIQYGLPPNTIGV